MSDLESDLRQLLSDYVAGQIPFREFDPRFARSTWDAAVDPATQRLVYETELVIAEFTSGHRSEEDLRAELSRRLGGVLEIHMAEAIFQWDATQNRGLVSSRVRTRASNDVRREAVLA